MRASLSLSHSAPLTLNRARRYFAENWGAPFIVAFILLLVASALELSLGSSDFANSLAVYAFYCLVIGVGLQVASYVRYGEGKGEPPVLKPRRTSIPRMRVPSKLRKMLIVAAAVWILAGTAFVYRTVEPLPPTTTIHSTTSPLSIRISFARSVNEPDGTVVAAFGVSVSGSTPPYTIDARWSDGLSQSNANGVFSRSFSANQSVIDTAEVVVLDSNGMNATLSVLIPPSS
jgi:hypothetical protein